MAELVVNLVIDNLVPLLKEEVNLLRGVNGEFERMKRELEFIKPYLKDADERVERGKSNDGVKALVKQVRKVSYRIEDVVDEYILHLLTQRSNQRRGFIYKVGRSILKCKPRHEIASKIQEITTTIGEIHQLRDRYDLKVIEEGSSSSSSNTKVKSDSTWDDPRVAFLFPDEVGVVGIETPRAELMTLMAEEASSKRRVISVVGEGGLGKTTLVKKVYDDQIASRKFICHAWITVSQSYNIKKLLRKLMKKFCETASNGTETIEEASLIGKLRECVQRKTMDEESLIGKLREYLQQKRYVVIFDDVWDIRFWNLIQVALPDDNKGSRVIVTTRNNGVATSCVQSKFDHIYKLNHLPDNKAWELFCKRAFQSDYRGICPPELKQVSDEIVRKCNGVPLAIVTIARLLSTKDKVVLPWRKFHDRLGSELESNPYLEDVKKIILFSYIDLSYNLRACFLYFGTFPEDYGIKSGRLVRLWIAEGFVREEKGKTLEETAKEYLKELVHRSLVQLRGGDTVDKKVRQCQVHDIMREIILLKNKELLLLAKDDSISDDGQFRRLSIHNRRDDNVMNGITKSIIRSVITFVRDEFPESFMGTLIENFKLLKVLDFEDARALNYLPKEVGNLLHLRYLSLKNTKVKVLPKSISKLHFLLTLNLKESLVDVLPIEINSLHKLRHLLASIGIANLRGVKMPKGFGCLRDLQELMLLDANDHGGSLFKELIMLRQLRKLGIDNLKREDGKYLCSAVENMRHLESLRVGATQNDILDLQYISSPPDSLQRLVLIGCLEKLPDWISKLQSLLKITLRDSRLTEDPLKFLQTLPSLLMLELDNAFDGEVLHFERGGFQNLKRFNLFTMTKLISVEVDTGALPVLQAASISECSSLGEFPKKFEKVRDLRIKKLLIQEEIREVLCVQKAAIKFIAIAGVKDVATSSNELLCCCNK